MVQAREPRENDGPAPTSGVAGTPQNPEKSEKDPAGNSTEVARALGPEVVDALRAATANRSPEPGPAVPAGEADGGPVVTRTGKLGKFATRRTATIAGGIASVLVVLFCLACSGVFGDLTSDPGDPLAAISADPGAVASAASPAPTARQPAAKPVRAAADLDAVCGNTYFPASPKYRGKGPHPVVISAKERLDLGVRSARELNRYAYSGPASAKKAWAPAAKQAQLVACLDLVGGGAKVKDCKTDLRSTPKMPLMVGRYKLTVYEVATGRKVSEATLTGAAKTCPWVVMTGSDPTLYTAVDDAQLYKALQAKVK